MLFSCLLALSSGCAHYEYDITRPPEFAQHIGTKTDVIIQRDPLEYRLITVENRLVVRIYNQIGTPIALLGDKCTVVDPTGQSHPLQSQTMAPHSFIKLIFPPLGPRVEPVGPYFGVGVGTMIGRPYRREVWEGYDGFDEPEYLVIYDNDMLYWNWSDESSVRVNLVFEQDQRTFEQGFVFSRKKA